jgi:putative membrane protein
VRFLTWLLTTAAALAVATWLFDGIYFTGPTSGTAEIRHKLIPLLVVALILGVVSSFVKPVATFFSIPFIVVTLGLFLLVINALMLMLTAWIAGALGLGFHVDGFWNALGGSIVITIVNAFISHVVLEDDKPRASLSR